MCVPLTERVCLHSQEGRLAGFLYSAVTPAISASYRPIANATFGPAEIKAMTGAYEAALLDLGLLDRDDPITEIVAAAIVSITSMGERHDQRSSLKCTWCPPVRCSRRIGRLSCA
jgi:hypothetical protein